MEGIDWVIGKGMEGGYYYGEKQPNRFWQETGFLFIILKGGVISLALFLLILLPAAYLGIFKSKNAFTRAAGIYVFVYILWLYPFGVPNFSFKYALVWISVWICYSKKLRKMPEEQMTNIMKTGKLQKSNYD